MLMIRVLTSCLLALFAAAVMHAQDTSKSEARKTDDARVTTISGCLGGGPNNTFVLTNVIASTSGDNKGDRKAAAAGVQNAYSLVPREGVALAPHVGRRVELTGAVLTPGTKGDDAKSDSADSAARARTPRGPEAQFAVTSVKVISPICIQ
jgi:hypothetical protein